MRLLLAIIMALAGAGVVAVERVPWESVPTVAYHGEPAYFQWRDGRDLQFIHETTLLAKAGADADGHGRIQFAIPADSATITIVQATGRVALQCLQPGGVADLKVVDRHLVTSTGDQVVLTLPRREAEEDRRWSWLRRRESAPDRRPCRYRVRLPDPGRDPIHQPLLRLIAGLGKPDLQGAGVVVELPPGDVRTGWQHRPYRQVLAWVIVHLRACGAQRVVLVPPCHSVPDAATASGLLDQVYDVARTYEVEAVARVVMDDLQELRYWRRREGYIGTTLNSTGQHRYEEALKNLFVDNPEDLIDG